MKTDGKNKIVFRNASNKDIIKTIELCIPEATRQLSDFSLRYKVYELPEIEICESIFTFLQRNIRYKADGTEYQDIRLPGRLLASKTGDCKSLSLFTIGVLNNLGIDCFLTYASYNPNDKTPTHVYVTTKSGIIIDVVWGRFNSEKPYFYKTFKRV